MSLQAQFQFVGFIYPNLPSSCICFYSFFSVDYYMISFRHLFFVGFLLIELFAHGLPNAIYTQKDYKLFICHTNRMLDLSNAFR